MARGRKKLPTELVRAHGSWRADYPKHSGREGEPKNIDPIAGSVPEWLSERGKVHYDKFVILLSSMKVIGESDKQALAALADALGNYLYYRGLLEEMDCHVVETQQGGIKAHPYVSMQNKAWDQFFKGAREFGLNPSARASVKVIEGEKAKTGKDRFFQTA